MDPNHWSNLNQQYAARLSAGGVPANPGSLSFLDQHGLAAGLGALSSSLPPHNSLTPHIPNLPAMSYSHTIQGTAMTQIFDTLTGQTYTPGQVPYKTVSVGQPAYSLDSPGRTNSESMTPRFSTQNPQTKLSLFNTDPHTMKEPSHSPIGSPPASTEPSKTWAVTSFMSPSSFFTVSGEAVIASSNMHSGSIQEPPPAHQGHIRVNMVQRTTYEGKPQYSESTNSAVQPPQAHNNTYGVEMPRSHMLEDMLKPSSHPPVAHTNNQASVHLASSVDQHHIIVTNQQSHLESRQPLNNPRCVERSQSLSSHSSFSETSPSLPNQQASYPNSPHIANQATPSPSSRPQQVTKVSHVPQPTSYTTYNSTMCSYTSSSSMNTMNYDPISPPAVNPEHQSMSLQDFADISSHQRKIPMSSTHSSTIGLQSGLQQQSASQAPSPHDTIQNTSSVDHLPVQAVADSTTKPKRTARKPPSAASSNGGAGRNNKNALVRKKKSQSSDDVQTPPIQIVGRVISPDSLPHQQFAISVIDTGQQNTSAYGTVSAESVGLAHIANPALAISQQTLTGQHHIITQDQPVFMTNTFGSTFIDPNKSCPASSRQEMAEGQNPLIDTNHDAIFTGTPLSPKQKYRTKAEQKQMPTVTIVESVDEEFAHLAEEPVLPNAKDKKPKPCAHVGAMGNPGLGGITHGSSLIKSTSSNAANILLNPPKPKPGKDFQSSFLSFLQGHKPETLSSVTNSAITVKPELPKYIPDPRPRIKPNKTAVDDEKKNPQDSKKVTIGSVAFSDDDDDESSQGNSNLAKTVEQVIYQLDDNSLKSGRITSRGRVTQSRRRTVSASSKSRGCGRKESTSRHLVAATGEPLKIGLDEMLPPREKVTRRAKEKAAEKRKSKKKKRRQLYSDESSCEEEEEEEDPDYVELTSSSDLEDKDYDSDKDPMWRPCDQNLAMKASKRRGSLLYEDEDDYKRLRMRTKRGKPTSSRRGRTSHSTSGMNSVDNQPAPYRPRPLSEELLQFLSDDDEIPHTYEKGNFVIDRRDLTKYEGYPIWKIDAGSLLQKYEPVLHEGQTVHKSLCTYLSWSDNIRERYKAIGVRWIQKGKERDQDLVEVLDQFKPKPVDDTLEEDPLMQAFNVYVQILVSQALEPGFLSAINSEDDDYYSAPTRIIDNMLDEKKKALVEKIKWTSNFQASVERYPYLSTGEEPETPTQSRPMLKAVQLSGKPYVRDTLEECSPTNSPDTRTSKEFLVSSRTATLMSIYHSLHHFKHTLHKRCCSKVMLLRGNVSADQSDILDQCLQNRAWVHKLFHNFRQLLEKASAAVQSSPSSIQVAGSSSSSQVSSSSSSQPDTSVQSCAERSQTTSGQLDTAGNGEPGNVRHPVTEESRHSPSKGESQHEMEDDSQLGTEDESQPCTGDEMQLGTSQLSNEEASQLPGDDMTQLSTEDSMQLSAEDNTQLSAEDTTQMSSSDTIQLSAEETTQMSAEETTQLSADEKTKLSVDDNTQLSAEDMTQLSSSDTAQLSAEDSMPLAVEDATQLLTKDRLKLATNDTAQSPGEDGMQLCLTDHLSQLASEELEQSADSMMTKVTQCEPHTEQLAPLVQSESQASH